MKISSLVFFVALSLVDSPFFSQDSQTPSPASPKKIEGDKTNAAPPAMRLYDVPPAREPQAEAPEEVADYFKITQTQDTGQRAQLVEDFLKKYPESKYVPGLHQAATSLYQQLNKYEKMIEHGEKTLLSFPSNPAILSLLALAYTTGGEWEKAIDRASKAIALIDKLTVPANVDGARWKNERDQYLAMNYASLGSSFVAKFEAERKAQKEAKATSQAQGASAAGEVPVPKKESEVSSKDQPPAEAPNAAAIHLAKALTYLSKAVDLNPRYEYAQFQLGVVLAFQNQAAKAMEAFAKTIALEGGFKSMARQNLESIYKVTHKDSLEGLDQMIAKAKEELTQKNAVVTAPQPK
jgi:tetratricopeptide (TPR) repeat protein